MDRRDFIRTGGILLVGASSAYGLRMLAVSSSRAPSPGSLPTTRKWGMVIDLNKCSSDCNVCMDACRKENNVAIHGDERWDIHWIRKVKIKSKNLNNSGEKSVPLLCNHCEHPPCAQVCPVQATYKRHDGIVIVDHHRCIGCRYCIIACPYNARYFNYKENDDWPNKDFPKRSHGVAEACTFCAHLLDEGKQPACVEACQRINAGAIMVGDLNDPESDVSQIIANNPIKRIREDLGTEPKVYYVGL